MDGRGLMVADLMTLDPVVVLVDAPLEEAAHLFHENSVTGVPVVDDVGFLVGVISQSDLIALDVSPVGRRIRGESSGLRVGEVMTSPAITVGMTTSLRDAPRVMIDRRVHRVVALDDDGNPVGVLSSTDFLTLYVDA
ncbi:MAG TPA: CBS domain-containing protein [Candidatus Limnocylindrales bacterium]|nr:CBS domain-containing protein [Candidatus Limnocylindrales bacterium]